jgi:hypothetical protein
MTKPLKSILERDFRYTPSTSTDVQETWRKHGWLPKKEQELQDKKLDRIIRRVA